MKVEDPIRKRIWKAVDDTDKSFSGTYWENYHLIKYLNLGHRPTKEETDEASFYSVAKYIGEGDADKGIKKVLSQFKKD